MSGQFTNEEYAQFKQAAAEMEQHLGRPLLHVELVELCAQFAAWLVRQDMKALGWELH